MSEFWRGFIWGFIGAGWLYVTLAAPALWYLRRAPLEDWPDE